MEVKFYGVRGSISVSGKEYTEFGGNTTCFQIMATQSRRIGIVDAGTGKSLLIVFLPGKVWS
jgi:hypothetical protein